MRPATQAPSRRDRIEAFANKVALRPVKVRKGKGRGRMSAAERDALAGLAILIERASTRGIYKGQTVVHVPVELILEVRKAQRGR